VKEIELNQLISAKVKFYACSIKDIEATLQTSKQFIKRNQISVFFCTQKRNPSSNQNSEIKSVFETPKSFDLKNDN
jgi:hypothetical protein